MLISILNALDMRRIKCLCIFFTSLSFSLFADSIRIELPILEVPKGNSLWIAVDAGPGFGSCIVSLEEERRIFLPFQADILFEIKNQAVTNVWQYSDFHWQPIENNIVEFGIGESASNLTLLKTANIDRFRKLQWFFVGSGSDLAIYKDHYCRTELEVYLPHYYEMDTLGNLTLRGRYGEPHSSIRIYQLMPRLFGNANEQRKTNGSIVDNGCGKFSDLSPKVLSILKGDGYSHIWLTGILQQATSTDYTDSEQVKDDPDLLKGIAGSPYAIRDYFDVSPDYAENPAVRMEEFLLLSERMKAVGLKVIIDFVPNHVARSYASDIRPDLDFGVKDQKNVFFDPANNFFYLNSSVASGEPPLRLPTVDQRTGRVIDDTSRIVGRADGFFLPEKVFGRVTGNNVVSWRPSKDDWYETIKLNYGYNFLNPDQLPEYPSALTPHKPVPDTWKKMDAVIAYWQSNGVDGFRVDMAHMVPPEFWKWLIHRARGREEDVFFFAEAYDNDPSKVRSHDPALRKNDNVMLILLDAGFDAVYDDPGYDILLDLYTRGAWANDLEDVEEQLGPFFFDRAVRYSENHDEIRLAHPNSWGNQGFHVGRPVTATLFGLSRGPVMIYNGQKVGEAALGCEGFGGDDQRTSIFDYWSMPELNKWWNNGNADGSGLSVEQSALREWYKRIINLQKKPAFTDGNFFPLNRANINNPLYGNFDNLDASGQWFFTYLRNDPSTEDTYLVTSNFHSDATIRDVRILLSQDVIKALDLKVASRKWLLIRDCLAGDEKPLRAITVDEVLRHGLYIDELLPLSAYYWEIKIVLDPPKDAVISKNILLDSNSTSFPVMPYLKNINGINFDKIAQSYER